MMIKAICSSLCALVLFALQVNGASLQDTLRIDVSWLPIENNYAGKEQALSVLTFKNNGEIALPKTGWRLYFNFIRIATPKNEQNLLDINHVNGDLFYFSPSRDFEGLKPGEEISYELISHSWLVNRSDAPQGFYVVWDDKRIQPLAAVDIRAPQDEKKFRRVANDKEETSASLFEQNQSIHAKIKVIPKKIFPTPQVYEEKVGHFELNHATKIVADVVFSNEVELLKEDLSALMGVQFGSGSGTGNTIQLKVDAALSEEAYRMEIDHDGVRIFAGQAAGAFYAIQSLKTLIDPHYFASSQNKSISLPAINVADEPRFGKRALMLDVARNFQSKAQILKVLDLMGLYKLNTLHFHLNDDEGWRLEIPSFPELTAIGSQRGHIFGEDQTSLPPSYGSGPFAGKNSGSGYYTEADFIEILQYATARHIRVIPEIETPGHARAAIKAMEARYQRLMKEGKEDEAKKYLLRDFDDQSVYRSVQKWNDNVMDVSMPSVYDFLEVVVDDVIALYQQAGAPLEIIHFGGDEVPNGVWEQSPAFAKLKAADEQIEHTDQLWDYYFDKVDNLLKARNLTLFGWEEVGMHKVLDENGKKRWIPNEQFKDRNIHLNVWNNLSGNEDLAYRLANAGYKVMLSFVSNFYLDMAYYKSFNEPGFYWGGFIDLDKPFSFIPFDYLKNQQRDWLGRQLRPEVLQNAEKLTEAGRKNIIGIQGLLWAETVKNPAQMEYLILPRFFALAEKAWAQAPNWETETDQVLFNEQYAGGLATFYHTLGHRELKRMDYYAGGFNYRIPRPGIKSASGKLYVNTQLPGFTVRYTVDGTEPTIDSPIVTQPIEFNDNARFKSFNDLGRGSAVSNTNN